jgi:hypothetical protein
MCGRRCRKHPFQFESRSLEQRGVLARAVVDRVFPIPYSAPALRPRNAKVPVATSGGMTDCVAGTNGSGGPLAATPVSRGPSDNRGSQQENDAQGDQCEPRPVRLHSKAPTRPARLQSVARLRRAEPAAAQLASPERLDRQEQHSNDNEQRTDPYENHGHLLTRIVIIMALLPCSTGTGLVRAPSKLLPVRSVLLQECRDIGDILV